MRNGRREKRSRAPGALMIAFTVSSSGCFPVPGPERPTGMTMAIGADHRANATNRWVCEGFRPASIVLAHEAAGYLLHDESFDGVATAVAEDDANVYFAWSNHDDREEAAAAGVRVDPGSDVVARWRATTSLEEGEIVVRVAASKQARGPLVFAALTPEGPTSMTCRNVEVLP